MRTNLIPITIKAPMLSKENSIAITKRISELHPQLDDIGIKQYLCDLLNVKSVDEITGEFLVFQEVEPAVSSEELHVLAHRILPYNDGNIHKAIFAARNILNTIPKGVDDLVDYVTKERFDEFASMVINSSIVGVGKDPKQYDSLDKLSQLFATEMTTVVDIICNAQMDHCRKTELEDQFGITERQNMLASAASYYLNHAIGFKCNTMWLACFMSSQYFGCQSGWFHHDGNLCHATHFGFKDDKGMIKLIFSSFDFISDFFDAARTEKNAQRTETANIYMQTLLFTLDALIKHCIDDGDDEDCENLIKLTCLINNNDDLLSKKDRLFFLTLVMAQSEGLGFTREYLDLLKEYVVEHDDEQAPPNHMLPLFDAWNFFAFDGDLVKSYVLAPMFLRSKYDEDNLMKFSSELLAHLINKDLSEHHENLLGGFFENYLFILVNENSDTMFMFDSILKVVKTAIKVKGDLDIQHILRAMAELGHAPSIRVLSKTTKGAEFNYWSDRIELIESVNL